MVITSLFQSPPFLSSSMFSDHCRCDAPFQWFVCSQTKALQIGGYLSIPSSPKSHINVSSILICVPQPITADSVTGIQDLGLNSLCAPSSLLQAAQLNLLPLFFFIFFLLSPFSRCSPATLGSINGDFICWCYQPGHYTSFTSFLEAKQPVKLHFWQRYRLQRKRTAPIQLLTVSYNYQQNRFQIFLLQYSNH